MELSVGQVVGDYRIIGAIGAGGMGTVYKVQHVISDRIEALKVILPDMIGTPELADRFIREIKLQARLSHPNIASLHNALRLDNQLLMVMEYLDGMTLYAKLREGKLPPATSIDIVLQVLNALGYAHAKGVIHRDVKPANIMLTTSGVVKLMDFGIARSATDTLQLTQTGAAVGSVYYMSPEQVQGRPVDARSDLYSVGVVLYEMVTGCKPLKGDSSWTVMNAHLIQVPQSPATLNSELSPPFCLAILKALEKNPLHRYQSASEFADVLSAVRTRHDVPSPHLSDVVLENLPPAHPSIALPAPVFSAAELQRVTSELAAHVGPMARILVQRAAKRAANWQQLYDELAQELPAGPERSRFLAKCPRG
ncbi:MAG TPA: serine/threonine-protein kinase [Bryobacteraceae bacterium]|nr:serine/threonine-protein kinase [Bryobacteraceae bacterium]